MRVLLGDRDSLLRDAVASALAGEADIEAIITASSTEETLQGATVGSPNVAILAQSLPGVDGTSLLAEVRKRLPACAVLVLGDSEDVDVLLQALESGASGYISKRAPLPELLQAARTVCGGDMAIPSSLVGPLVARLIRRREDQERALLRLSRLSQREQAVLELLAEGGDTGTIAKALVISSRTATTHVQNIMHKLEVHSRLEAATFLARSGLQREALAERWQNGDRGQGRGDSLVADLEDRDGWPSFVIQRKQAAR